MIRTITLFFYLVGYSLFSLIPLYKVKQLDKKSEYRERDILVHKTVKRWARAMVNFIGAKIEVIGEENIPKDRAVLFVGNHQSNFDIPILLGFIDTPMGFIAKIETKKIPIVRTWMGYIKCVFMDRKDIRQSLRSINQGIKYLKEGNSMIIFPEGTRSQDDMLEEFKPGSLKLAMKSEVPIIPITMKDTYKIMSKKNRFKINSATVQVIISKPLIVEEIDGIDTKTLSDNIRNIIKQNLSNS